MPFGVPIPPSPDTSVALLLLALRKTWYPFHSKTCGQGPRPFPETRHARRDGEEMPFDLFLGNPKTPRSQGSVVEESTGMTENG